MEQSVTLRQLQEVYLDMMQQFHAFCVERDLTYYMVGGTLLGAVREQGFIPWDDDVDFAMPRPDYERFIREYTGKMVLQSRHGEAEYYFPYIKLFHWDTPILHVEDDLHGVRSEVFVKFDIYPIDGVGNDWNKALKLTKKVRFRKKLLYWNLTKEKSRNAIKNAVLTLIRKIPSRMILESIDKTMQRYSTENSALWTRWREGAVSENIVDRTVFSTPVLLPFENASFYAPREYHTYLTGVYGGYTVRKKQNGGMRHDTNHNELTKQFAQIVSAEGPDNKEQK